MILVPVTDLCTVTIVAATKGTQQPFNPLERIRNSRATGCSKREGHALRTTLCRNTGHLPCNGIERLVPADPHPTRVDVIFRASTFHRIQQAIIAIHLFRRRLTLGTQCAPRRMRGIRLDTD